MKKDDTYVKDAALKLKAAKREKYNAIIKASKELRKTK